jgi:hypothetical protein
MNDHSPRFPQFEGRYREWARITPILKEFVGPVLGSLFPGWFEFLEAHYSLRVPYHNRIHIAYGLLWLVEQDAKAAAVLAWLGHDAGHNGNAKQSPESVSADILRDAIGHDDLRRAILHTAFPYVSNPDEPQSQWRQKPAESVEVEGVWLRLADTYRPYAGLAGNLGVAHLAFTDACFFECLGLSEELYEADGTTTFLGWIENGQADFFPRQIDLGLDAGVFGSEIDVAEAHLSVEHIRNWLWSSVGDDRHIRDLLTLRRIWLGDVTLPEFVAERRLLLV